MDLLWIILILLIIAAIFGGFAVNNLIWIVVVVLVIVALFALLSRGRGGPPVV